MIAQASNNNCIARALSTMRLALGYPTGTPTNYDLGQKRQADIATNLAVWFPEHSCFVAMIQEEKEKSHLGENVKYLGDNFTWGNSESDINNDEWLVAFSYHNSQEKDPIGHMVIGAPTTYTPGCSVSIVIGVALTKNKERII